MKAMNPASIGLTNGEFAHASSRSHRLRNHYEQNAAARKVIDFVASWELGRDEAKLFPSIVENLLDHDPSTLLADYESCIYTGPSESAVARPARPDPPIDRQHRAHARILLCLLDPRLLRARTKIGIRARYP
jgi:hypothetical protein